MTHGERAPDRVLDLLADLALEGSLGAEDQRELQALLAARAAAGGAPPQREVASLEVAAAAVLLTCHEKQFAPMPEHLAARIQASFPAAEAPRPPASPPPASRPADVVPIRPRRDVLRWVGWVAAAACFLLALLALRRSRTLEAALLEAQRRPTAAEARAALTAEKDVVTLPWKSTEDPDAKGASGDVVWSGGKQAGYMRIRGLAANDPTRSQYQLSDLRRVPRRALSGRRRRLRRRPDVGRGRRAHSQAALRDEGDALRGDRGEARRRSGLGPRTDRARRQVGVIVHTATNPNLAHGARSRRICSRSCFRA
ncbi:MAG: anti-sigma factor [Minicystis sp.]